MKTKTLSTLAVVAVLAISVAVGYLLQSPDEAPKSAKSVENTPIHKNTSTNPPKPSSAEAKLIAMGWEPNGFKLQTRQPQQPQND